MFAGPGRAGKGRERKMTYAYWSVAPRDLGVIDPCMPRITATAHTATFNNYSNNINTLEILSYPSPHVNDQFTQRFQRSFHARSCEVALNCCARRVRAAVMVNHGNTSSTRNGAEVLNKNFKSNTACSASNFSVRR
jgi:hypothetical protein